jgi:hypothetical protein
VIASLFIRQKKDKSKSNINMRQTARWSTAVDQDKSPLIGLLYANYGVKRSLYGRGN